MANTPKLQRRHDVQPPSKIEISPAAGFGHDVAIDITGDVMIEPRAYLAHQAKLITHRHSGHSGPPDPDHFHGELVRGALTIEHHAFVGECAVILPQCRRIGAWAVVGAHSVVTKDIGPGEIWAGNPAKFIRMREGMTRQSAE